MATKTEYTTKKVFVTVTCEEIEKLLIERYASLGLLSVPDVEFKIGQYTGLLEEAVIDYEIREPVVATKL